MPMYNLIEYSNNLSDTSGSLWQFKRDEVPTDNRDLAINNSQSFRYKVTLLGKPANAVNDTNSSVKEAKILSHTILHFPIVNLSTKDSANLAKQLNEGSVHWNSYETKPEKVIKQGKHLYELPNASFQSVKRLFNLAYFIAAPSDNNIPVNDTAGIKNNKKYFLPRGETTTY